MRAHLTKRVIDAFCPTTTRIMVFDDQLRGFALRVEPSGAKTFIVSYRANGGGRGAPQRLLTIGRYGTLTVDQARAEARRVLADVKLGGDPGGDRRRRRAMPTFGEMAEEMLAEAIKIAEARPREARLRLNTIRSYRSLLKRHVQPEIGSTKIDSVTTANVQRLHRRLGAVKPMTANRCLEFISSVYKEAAMQGILPPGTNPARGIPAFRENRRERFLSLAELSALGAALAEAESAGIPWRPDLTKKSKHVPKSRQRTKLDPHAAAALRLLILTGARLREILHAKWTGVDLDRGLLTVFGKTGSRYVILPAAATAILSTLPRIGEFVIAGDTAGKENERPRADLNRPWRLIRDRAGLASVRIHDLRHSHASLAASGGASLPIIGKLLGHTQPQTTARYSHLADDPVRAVAEKVGAAAASALEGRSGEIFQFTRDK
jgi:integrase